MRILLDENMPAGLVVALIEEGHHVESVKSLRLAGIDNGALYSLAQREFDYFLRETPTSESEHENRNPQAN